MGRLSAVLSVALSATFVFLVAGCRAGDLVPRSTACERAWVLTGKAEDIGLRIPEDVAAAATRHCDADDETAASEVSWNRSFPDQREHPKACSSVTSDPADDDASRLAEAQCVGDWADFVQYMDERPRSCVEPANLENQRETSTARYRELAKTCSAEVSAKADETTFGDIVSNGLAQVAVVIAGLYMLYALFKGAWSD